MRIIISPAKRMRRDPDSLPWRQLPTFLDRAEALTVRLQELSREQLQTLWRCNDQITAINRERLAHMDLRRGLTPAILAYEGIQYQYMAPGVFTQEQFVYLEERLRILSGLYGLLRPFDGVTPYRLEMQAKLEGAGYRSLYDFWGDALARRLESESGWIVNLASREYSRCITEHLSPQTRCTTCVFGQLVDGRVVERGTLCKMARGEMVRYMAEQNIQSVQELQSFTRQQYRFAPERSNEDTYVFLKGEDQHVGSPYESA